MAEIDKSLPNIKPEDQILLEQGVEQELPDITPETKSPVEITDMEDGGAEISFDPAAEQNNGHKIIMQI
jgi:hypothetical protein